MKTEIEKLKNEILAEFEKKASEILAAEKATKFKRGSWYHRIWDDGDQDIIRCNGFNEQSHDDEVKYTVFWRITSEGEIEDLTRPRQGRPKTIQAFDSRLRQQWKRISVKKILKGFNP